MCRTGSVAGSNGPTAFLLSGKRKRKAFSNGFFVKYGAAYGRTIAITESGYMTEESWLDLSPSMYKEIRCKPFVQDNPQW